MAKRSPPTAEVGFYIVAPTWLSCGAANGLHEIVARLRAGWQPPGLGLSIRAEGEREYGGGRVDRLCNACIMTHISNAALDAADVIHPPAPKARDNYRDLRRRRGTIRTVVRGRALLHVFRGEPTAAALKKTRRACAVTVKSLRRAGYQVKLVTDEGCELLAPTGRWKNVCGSHERRG